MFLCNSLFVFPLLYFFFKSHERQIFSLGSFHEVWFKFQMFYHRFIIHVIAFDLPSKSVCSAPSFWGHWAQLHIFIVFAVVTFLGSLKIQFILKDHPLTTPKAACRYFHHCLLAWNSWLMAVKALWRHTELCVGGWFELNGLCSCTPKTN